MEPQDASTNFRQYLCIINRGREGSDELIFTKKYNSNSSSSNSYSTSSSIITPSTTTTTTLPSLYATSPPTPQLDHFKAISPLPSLTSSRRVVTDGKREGRKDRGKEGRREGGKRLTRRRPTTTYKQGELESTWARDPYLCCLFVWSMFPWVPSWPL